MRNIEPEVKKPKSGQVSSSNSRGVSMSLSNYVSLGAGGDREAQEYFKSKISKANLDSSAMIKDLNADKRVFGKWSLAEENDDRITLQNEDSFGNINYVSITK